MENKNIGLNTRILIVDDNPKNLQVLGGVLRSNNYEIEFSTSGEGALKWIKEEDFNLILLDVMMPEMDGFETCSKIRKIKSSNELPIIFLTAKTEKESILKGFHVGGQDYVIKPFDSNELLARVNTHLELSFARKKLKDLNANLEKMVVKRTEQLKKANEELEALDSIKVQFLNMLSHEIRTPLNGIKVSLQLLKVRVENEDLVQLLNILDVSVNRLEEFGYTALLLTRLKSEKYRFSLIPINILEELDFCLLPLNEKLLAKKIKIDTKVVTRGLKLNTDKELFHELFKRVLENAIKYTPEDSTITISAVEKDKFVSIKIQDEAYV